MSTPKRLRPTIPKEDLSLEKNLLTQSLFGIFSFLLWLAIALAGVLLIDAALAEECPDIPSVYASCARIDYEKYFGKGQTRWTVWDTMDRHPHGRIAKKYKRLYDKCIHDQASQACIDAFEAEPVEPPR
jgi:hypothetical protein